MRASAVSGHLPSQLWAGCRGRCLEDLVERAVLPGRRIQPITMPAITDGKDLRQVVGRPQEAADLAAELAADDVEQQGGER